jgi:cytochrome c oxidase subunit 3
MPVEIGQRHHAEADASLGGHRLVAHHFDDAPQQREAALLGMWSFLATEVLFFGGLFLAYAIYRLKAPLQVTLASHHLNIPLGALNTAVLLVSSLLVALAVRAAQLGKTRQVVWLLVGTIALGSVFLGIKAVEWHTDWKENLVPFFGNWDWNAHAQTHDAERLQSAFQSRVSVNDPEETTLESVRYFGLYRMFFVIYFFMTGLHAIHLIIGLVIFGIVISLVLRRARKGTSAITLVEVTGLYWHFIDIVWVFLYPLLYLIDPRPHP